MHLLVTGLHSVSNAQDLAVKSISASWSWGATPRYANCRPWFSCVITAVVWETLERTASDVEPLMRNAPAAAWSREQPPKYVMLTSVQRSTRRKLWFGCSEFALVWTKFTVLVVKCSHVSVIKTNVLHTQVWVSKMIQEDKPTSELSLESRLLLWFW